MAETEVLIVGAGPTGMVLALGLARVGVAVRIVDKNSGSGLQSRAMVVQARTLEFYRQFGFAEETVARGIKIDAFQFRRGNRVAVRLLFGEIGAGLSPYPFVLCFPQDDHERLLNEQLIAAGVAIEWNTEMTAFTDGGDRVTATLRKAGSADTDETVEAAYLCGCDGARSTIRTKLALRFPGGTYEQVFYVADVAATGDAAQGHDINICMGDDGFCGIFPVRSSGMHRLIGVLPAALRGRESVTFEDLRPTVEALAPIHVSGPANWFSTYHVHHRVASHFRIKRVFVAGDAGHVHSPAGGQGMNTGIGDAINLGWKLAAVLQNRAAPAILDTYETERIAFAKTLVATTDRAFQLMVGKDAKSRFYRTVFLPHLAPVALRFDAARQAMFRLLSQTRIRYRASQLSAPVGSGTSGAGGEIRAGDRLPWVAALDNFAPLRTRDWQIHVYGTPTTALRESAAKAGIAVCEFAADAAKAAGLQANALYLIRPDGYVALVDSGQNVGALDGYLGQWGIRGRG